MTRKIKQTNIVLGQPANELADLNVDKMLEIC